MWRQSMQVDDLIKSYMSLRYCRELVNTDKAEHVTKWLQVKFVKCLSYLFYTLLSFFKMLF